MHKPLKSRVRFVEESLVTSYQFSFTSFGWATIVVDEVNNSLMIDSDWGKWAHTWLNGLVKGKSFTEFLSSSNQYYIANKLGYDTETREIDEEATRISMKKAIISNRRNGHTFPSKSLEGYSLKERVREVWDSVIDFCEYLESDSSHALNSMVSDHMLDEFDPIDEWIEFKDTSSHAFLRDELIPIFLAHLKARLGDNLYPIPLPVRGFKKNYPEGMTCTP